MSFGKSKATNRRHRPKKEPEVDENQKSKKRTKLLNTHNIPVIISVVGIVFMLGIVILGAPYSYGSQVVRYTKSDIKDAINYKKDPKKYSAIKDSGILIDFTNIIAPKETISTSEAMRTVSRKCRQGRSSHFSSVAPHKVHRAFDKVTKFLNCAMRTDISRFCHQSERKLLVNQLIDYKQKRQNVLAFEKYRDKVVASREALRKSRKERGEPIPDRLDITNAKIPQEFNPTIIASIEYLVKNGYLSAADFGYYGLYVPEEYQKSLSLGSERYAVCDTKT